LRLTAAGVSAIRRAAEEKLPLSALRTNDSRLAKVSIPAFQILVETDSILLQLSLGYPTSYSSGLEHLRLARKSPAFWVADGS
jgi:hypothetical protein